ncbi:hypothetical protein QJS66_10215 [Kocuria rhizophila]|nr:hypothetical protein QJS66_10215 [Kocuria rhizophila]
MTRESWTGPREHAAGRAGRTDREQDGTDGPRRSSSRTAPSAPRTRSDPWPVPWGLHHGRGGEPGPRPRTGALHRTVDLRGATVVPASTTPTATSPRLARPSCRWDLRR